MKEDEAATNAELQEKSRRIIGRMERDRGIVRTWPRLMAQRDPDWLERWHDLTMYVLTGTGHLSRKVKELMLVAVDAATFYDYGVRVHTQGALAAGATEAELIETLEVVSIVNRHGLTSMVEIVVDEIAKFEASKDGSAPAVMRDLCARMRRGELTLARAAAEAVRNAPTPDDPNRPDAKRQTR